MRKQFILAVALVLGFVFFSGGWGGNGECRAAVGHGTILAAHSGFYGSGSTTVRVRTEDGYRYKYTCYNGHHHRDKRVYKRLLKVERKIVKLEKRLHNIHRKLHRGRLSRHERRDLIHTQRKYERELDILIRDAHRLRRILTRGH